MTASHYEVAAKTSTEQIESAVEPGRPLSNLMHESLGARVGKDNNANHNLEAQGLLPQALITTGTAVEATAERRQTAQESTRLHDNLSALHSWTGRSNHNIEKDLRDTLATMNSAEIAALSGQYKSHYGIDLQNAIASDSSLSRASKEAIHIYMKGADHLGKSDTLNLADIATRTSNLDMFEEAFRDAAPEASSTYLATGGAAKVQAAFGGFFSDSDLRHAMDYVIAGKLVSQKNSPSASATVTAASAREAFNKSRQQEYKSNNGIGQELIRNFWDNSSDMSTDAINQYAAAMTRNAAAGSTISAAAQAANQERLDQNLSRLKKSKDAAGDIVADGVLVVAGVGGAAFTGGASLALIGAVTAGGAAGKIATKAAISGEDYDYSAGHLLADGATGAVTTATMFVGPAQIARLAGITAERAALSLGTEIALNSSAGAASGAATGTVEGMTKWDRTKNFSVNFGTIAETALSRGITGALLAGALSGTISGVARLHPARAAEGPALATAFEQSAQARPWRDIDGRPLTETAARRELIAEKFAPLPEADRATLRAQVATELKDVKAITPNGQSASAYDSLIEDATLSSAQKENILNNLGLVREHLASYRLGGRMHPDPELNWIHTQGEIAKVLEVGRASKLSPEEMEEALLASMYSDSVKFSAPAPEGTVPNFHTHHLDGALAAEQSLKLQGFPEQRIDNVVEAILAHQITPPKFMGQLYYLKINGTLEALIKAEKVSASEGEQLRKTLQEMTTVGPDSVKRISKLADVSQAPVSTDLSGRQQVIFTAAEQKLLALSGTDRWTVPYKSALDPNFSKLSRTEQELRLSRGKVADKMKDADCADNYATSGGASKIVALRGPGSPFMDKTVWDSIGSIDASFQDSYAVMSKEGRAVADASLGNLKKVTDDKSGTLKQYMDKWLKDNKGLDANSDTIPFYNAPLTYPRAGETPTEGEIGQIALAEEIRSAVINFLRRDHRVLNDLPGNFAAVRH